MCKYRGDGMDHLFVRDVADMLVECPPKPRIVASLTHSREPHSRKRTLGWPSAKMSRKNHHIYNVPHGVTRRVTRTVAATRIDIGAA